MDTFITEDEYQRNDNECFICFENKKENELPYLLKSQSVFVKSCSCDGWVHNSCLQIWCNTNEQCPICRKIMYKINLYDDIEYNFNIIFLHYILKVYYSYFFNIIIKFRNVIIFCAVISNISNIVFLIYKEDKYYNYDSCDYNNNSLHFC